MLIHSHARCTLNISITLAGQSEYKVNNKVVTATEYNKNLESHSILVKAKNFLVFQVNGKGGNGRAAQLQSICCMSNPSANY